MRVIFPRAAGKYKALRRIADYNLKFIEYTGYLIHKINAAIDFECFCDAVAVKTLKFVNFLIPLTTVPDYL
ncbi:hypothetical protein AFK69_18650 [Xenorhabdus sp. GDc328]|nr:hypothetical protein AAY47_19320 [Xenorhabdus griffiniae]KOP31854.1 hypothetical protein AFK69_18650 [Xenorhabdus sp. GDc328]